MLRPDSSFVGLAELWLADFELRDIAEGTKQHYRDQLRLHVRPALEHYTWGETTHRPRRVIPDQSAFSYSRGRQSRALLNLIQVATGGPGDPVAVLVLGLPADGLGPDVQVGVGEFLGQFIRSRSTGQSCGGGHRA